MMAMRVSDVQAWLDTLPDDEDVYIDEGGLSLCVCDQPDVYCEVGGYEGEDDE